MKYPHTATAMIPEANIVWNKIPHMERFEGPTNSIAVTIQYYKTLNKTISVQTLIHQVCNMKEHVANLFNILSRSPFIVVIVFIMIKSLQTKQFQLYTFIDIYYILKILLIFVDINLKYLTKLHSLNCDHIVKEQFYNIFFKMVSSSKMNSMI